MNSEFRIPTLGDAPSSYAPRPINLILRSILLAFTELRTPGRLEAKTLNISSLPTSATGLAPGDVWSDAGTLKIVS